MKKLAEETARVLSHFRPGPDLLEATRTALALCAIYHVPHRGAPRGALAGRPATAAPARRTP